MTKPSCSVASSPLAAVCHSLGHGIEPVTSPTGDRVVRLHRYRRTLERILEQLGTAPVERCRTHAA